MRKAVCKNNRQQVVLKKKVVDLKELLVRTVVVVCVCACVLKRQDAFYSCFPW